jgi:hypothetical protein
MKRICLLLMFGVVACAANTPSTRPALTVKGNGSIAGIIQYPEKTIPAMQVCALNTQTQTTSCIKTRAGQAQYLIKGLPAADYYVLANMGQGPLKVGGHMVQVQCIRAPCPALLKAISVTPKQALSNINLNGFYSSREDFPVLSK